MNMFENDRVNSAAYIKARFAAEAAVNHILKTSLFLINSDSSGYFLYKDPKLQIVNRNKSVASQWNYDPTVKLEESPINWVSIHDFSLHEIMNQIRDFIMLWNLSPTTKFILTSSQDKLLYKCLGTSFLMTALFSKPTSRCPNPLPVARVRFFVNVSDVLPTHFPVMVVYRFEGYQTDYYALGEKQIRSWDFQRYFIDSIIERKMEFYAKLFECRHPETIVMEEMEVVEEGPQDIASKKNYHNNNDDEM